jgi:multidrug efflux pump subunit AcrA (membrane-fusion protein)
MDSMVAECTRRCQMPICPRRFRLRVAALALLLGLAGWQQAAAPAAKSADVSRPAESLEVTSAPLRTNLRFPGRVRAVQRVELAFNVPGRIIEFSVTGGHRLRPKAKEPVVSPQSPDAPEIVVHVPERVMRGEPRRVVSSAVFADLPERRFPVTVESFATESDRQTQNYDAVIGLTPPTDLRVLPRMTVEVLPDAAAIETGGDVADAGVGVLIPIQAVAPTASRTRSS